MVDTDYECPDNPDLKILSSPRSEPLATFTMIGTHSIVRASVSTSFSQAHLIVGACESRGKLRPTPGTTEWSNLHQTKLGDRYTLTESGIVFNLYYTCSGKDETTVFRSRISSQPVVGKCRRHCQTPLSVDYSYDLKIRQIHFQ